MWAKGTRHVSDRPNGSIRINSPSRLATLHQEQVCNLPARQLRHVERAWADSHVQRATRLAQIADLLEQHADFTLE